MGSHITDWHPGRVSLEYRENYERIFKGDCGSTKFAPCPECTCVTEDCEVDCSCGQE